MQEILDGVFVLMGHIRCFFAPFSVRGGAVSYANTLEMIIWYVLPRTTQLYLLSNEVSIIESLSPLKPI